MLLYIWYVLINEKILQYTYSLTVYLRTVLNGIKPGCITIGKEPFSVDLKMIIYQNSIFIEARHLNGYTLSL